MIQWHHWQTGVLRWATWPSPLGPLWVAWQHDALVAGEFGSSPPDAIGNRSLIAADLPSWVERLYHQAFCGEPLQIPLSRPDLTALDRALLSTATEIPFGVTASYGTVAAWAGFPGRARAAGRAMRRAPLAYMIPTHRVIRADGTAAPCQRDPLNDQLRRYEGIFLAVRARGMSVRNIGTPTDKTSR